MVVVFSLQSTPIDIYRHESVAALKIRLTRTKTCDSSVFIAVIGHDVHIVIREYLGAYR